ncbi:hypothetical protein N0V90_001465 [Kalmusia sp. IMI 367209]|nr:hypothetical protein N0V90_001465 [Kalmusia sp. IMI 367209]
MPPALTYLALLRLRIALSSFQSDKVIFTLRFAPYQLYPEFSSEGQDRYEWYKKEKYNDDEDRMRMYTGYMAALFEAENVLFTPHGIIANTLPAHRLVHCVQESKGPDEALRLVESLYALYFTRGAHPSSEETLKRAYVEARLEGDAVEAVVSDEGEGLLEVKSAIREQAGNGVDSVPYIVFEGRRRDFTLVGAKEVSEYVKTMEQVAKEA